MAFDAETPAPRQAPKAGYATDAKAAYRQDVWASLGRSAGEENSGKVLIMPSHEGLEIDVALDHGVSRDDLVCVDRSAAVIATSKWRRRHPDIQFFASEIRSVPARLKARGWFLKAANLDLCGTFSDQLLADVAAFLAGSPRSADFRIAVTLAKGREGSALATLLRRGPSSELGLVDPRMATLWHTLTLDVVGLRSPWLTVEAQGSYRSGQHPMTWAAVRIEDADHYLERRYGQVRRALLVLEATALESDDALAAADRLVAAEVAAGITVHGEIPEIGLRKDRAVRYITGEAYQPPWAMSVLKAEHAAVDKAVYAARARLDRLEAAHTVAE